MLAKLSLRRLAALLIVLPLTSCGPQNYNDCILENLRGVSNDQVARQVARACRAKFPIQSTNRDGLAVRQCTTRQMTSSELAKIQISATVNARDKEIVDLARQFGGTVEGTVEDREPELKVSIYNGNPIDIEKIFVRISAPNFTAPQDYGVQRASIANAYPLVEANSANRDLRVSLATFPADGWRYQVVSAETCAN